MSGVETDQNKEELVIDETNKELTIRSKNFTFRFGHFPYSWLRNFNHLQTYSKECARLECYCMDIQKLHAKVPKFNFNKIESLGEARQVYEEEMNKVATRLAGMLEELNEIDSVRERIFRQHLYRSFNLPPTLDLPPMRRSFNIADLWML